MAQVLPYVPSPLEQLTPYINQAQEAIMQGLQRRQGNKDVARLLQPQQTQGQAGQGQAAQAQTPIQSGSQMQEAPEDVVQKAIAIGDAKTRATGDANAGKLAANAYIEGYKIKQKQNLQERKFDFEREQTAKTETKDLRSRLSEGYRTALSNEKIYESMEKLNEKNLAKPVQALLAEKLGIPISALSNPESEQWEKLEQTLTRQISNYYPGQIRVVEFQSFLRQIPTLMNSKEGRSRVLATLKALDEIPKLEFQTYREIVKENHGQIPLDLNEQISERMTGKIDEIGKKLDKAINPSGKVLVTSPSGEVGYVSQENLEKAKEKGYTINGG